VGRAQGFGGELRAQRPGLLPPFLGDSASATLPQIDALAQNEEAGWFVLSPLGGSPPSPSEKPPGFIVA
jgi:hypothetical protein